MTRAGDARDRWNRRLRERPPMDEPARFLVERAGLLPRSGRAIDVAGGGGRNALWLAARGLDVTLVDVSDEACAVARRRAAAAGVPLDVLRVDLDGEPLPAGPWDVVLVHHYLARDLVRAAPTLLAPSGLFLLCQPTVRNLERHARPSRRWLLEERELGAITAEVVAEADCEVLELSEGWSDEGRHEARLVLRSTESA